jgi:tetratricopeptide (TPR) repeat protein
LYKTGFNLTLAYVKGKKYPEAIRTGEELLSQGKRTTELYSLLAQAYEHSDRTKDAYEALRSATKLDPKDESAYIELIALCLDHENYDLSQEIADIGTRLIPGSARLRLQKGLVLALLSRFDEAAKEFETAIQLAPEAPLGHVAKGLVLLRMDRADEAIEALRGRVRQEPDDYFANWLLAESLLRIGANADAEREAIAALEQSVRSNARMPQSRTLLGKLLLARGEIDRAVEQLEKALELDADSVTAAYQLAQAYRRKGDIRRANELFARVSKAKSEDPSQFTQRSLLRIVREQRLK